MNHDIKLIEIEQSLKVIVKLLDNLITKKESNILTQKELLQVLDISPNTLKSWEKNGLKRLEPPIENTRTVFYILNDVIKFLSQH